MSRDSGDVVLHQFQIRIYINGNQDDSGVTLNLVSDISLEQFLQICKQKLGMEAKRIFSDDGTEIKDIEYVKLLDEVWISSGSGFKKINQIYRKSTRDEFSFHLLSVALLGRGKVGKSSLAKMYVEDEFSEDYEPTMQDKHMKIELIEGDSVQIEILDTAGEEEFAQLRIQWMLNKEAIFFVYSVDDANSFEEIKILYSELQRIYSKQPQLPVICLIGNKMDVPNRKITYLQGQRLAKSMDALFFECSASDGSNVKNAFKTTFIKVHQRSHNQFKKQKDLPQKKEGFCIDFCNIF